MLRKAAMLIVAVGVGVCTVSSVCLGAPSEHKISAEVAVVTELPPVAVEITDWDLSVQTDLPNDRLKIRANCTIRNRAESPVERLDFDLLRAEKFYGVKVKIAKIARLVGGKEVDVNFKRFMKEEPKDLSQAGTHGYPLWTRVFLSPVLTEGGQCQLVFDYTITCVDIMNDRLPYKLICEPEKGMKQTCLMTDFAWFPRPVTAPRESKNPMGENFFSRGSRPAWRVTLTYPTGQEGMVLGGKLEKSERAGGKTVSQWKSIIGGTPQLFIGPAERVEKKREGVTAVFLLPRGKYNPEFVDAVGDLLTHAYPVFTDWFGPLEGNEIRIVATSGIRGGHSAFMGMMIGPSYFQTSTSGRMAGSGKFFTQTPVHELAHSWWPASYGRGTKFLRESLSNFATWHLARQYYGRDLFKIALHKSIFEGDRGARALFNAGGDAESLAYQKGPLVIDFLRQEMGDEVFFRTLKEYVRRYRNAHATFIDFVSVCNEVSRRDWMPFFYQWCYGKGCPVYRLVGFESKEAKDGWETKVKICNDGVGIVRCPLELRMEDGHREEVFCVPGGKWRMFVYRTDKKVTDVAIDPEETAYQMGEKGRRPIDPARIARLALPAPRLVAWWKLDEADGNDVADASGNGCVGAVIGNPERRWQPGGGRVNGALAFDGTSGGVEIENERAFDITEAITIAAWIKVNRFDKRWQSIVSKGDTAWRIQRTASEDTLAFHCTGIESARGYWGIGIEGKRTVSDGEWHHVVGVYDGATVSLYIDGVLDNSSDASGSILTNDFPVLIGGNSEASGREWNGLIDEVCIFDGAIDGNDVRALYSGNNPMAITEKNHPRDRREEEAGENRATEK